MRNEPTKRFWSKVKKTRDGCWLWMGRCNTDGYGIGPNRQLAHRFAYELKNGPIPKGKLIRHFKCHNRACVRPGHLKTGTNYQNALDTYRHHRPMHPFQRAVVGIGLRAEKKYGKTERAKKRGRANYRAWKWRVAHRGADELNRLMLRNLERIEGMLHLTGKDGKQVTIPVGGRTFFYEHVLDDCPIRMRPSPRFNRRQLQIRRQVLKKYEDFTRS